MRKQKSETIVLKKGKQEIQLDYAELRKAVLVLRAINHKLRQRMIDLLEENERMTVTDIYIKLRLEQSVASQHLAILPGSREGCGHAEPVRVLHTHPNDGRRCSRSRNRQDRVLRSLGGI